MKSREYLFTNNGWSSNLNLKIPAAQWIFEVSILYLEKYSQLYRGKIKIKNDIKVLSTFLSTLIHEADVMIQDDLVGSCMPISWLSKSGRKITLSNFINSSVFFNIWLKSKFSEGLGRKGIFFTYYTFCRSRRDKSINYTKKVTLFSRKFFESKIKNWLRFCVFNVKFRCTASQFLTKLSLGSVRDNDLNNKIATWRRTCIKHSKRPLRYQKFPKSDLTELRKIFIKIIWLQSMLENAKIINFYTQLAKLGAS